MSNTSENQRPGMKAIESYLRLCLTIIIFNVFAWLSSSSSTTTVIWNCAIVSYWAVSFMLKKLARQNELANMALSSAFFASLAGTYFGTSSSGDSPEAFSFQRFASSAAIIFCVVFALELYFQKESDLTPRKWTPN